MGGGEPAELSCGPRLIQSHVYAGIAGLASALALTRVGHRVTVLEKGNGKSNVSGFSKAYAVDSPWVRQLGRGGIRIPPNMSKILFHWGLKDLMKELGLTSHPLLFSQCEPLCHPSAVGVPMLSVSDSSHWSTSWRATLERRATAGN